jgi:hypothetical protein
MSRALLELAKRPPPETILRGLGILIKGAPHPRGKIIEVLISLSILGCRVGEAALSGDDLIEVEWRILKFCR